MSAGPHYWFQGVFSARRVLSKQDCERYEVSIGGVRAKTLYSSRNKGCPILVFALDFDNGVDFLHVLSMQPIEQGKSFF